MLIDQSEGDPELSLEAVLVKAIQRRQAHGLETVLRDLHHLLDVSQPVALRLARRLEQEGVVTIEPNLNDGFASVIRIASAVRVERYSPSALRKS